MFRIVLPLLAVALLALAPAASPAPSAGLVLGQVYAGGGNAGATYTNDYVELVNRGSSSVDLTGWSVQYASSASTSWSATPLAGTVPAGGHYLVALADGTVGAALPGADATGTTNLAASGGKVALVSSATALTCGAAAGSCAAQASVVDLLGYGSATDYEGSAAAPALSATTAAVRAGGGCTDTDDNAKDFTAAAPTPQNSTSPAAACAAPPAGGPTSTVGVGLDLQPAIALSLDRSSVSFGSVLPGSTPAPVTVAATVVSNDAAGYSLTVHRSAFTPADLPLAIARSGGSLTAIPVAPAADLQLVSTSAASAPAGDVWPTSLGFVSALPLLTPAHYAATVTYTVIGR
ncbi:MAG TPA: lamin tail domain-containing protein [Gaiellaceae bacterium]|nr:lamin tail domain-containing protein [Gaiellaceae bacterium]